MSLVILQPTANSEGTAHYRQTIEQPVPSSEWLPLVTKDVADRLTTSFRDGAVPFWGVTEGDGGRNQTKWKRINPGDLVLFARGGSYFALATVALPFENEALAEVLWQRNSHGETWKFMYAVDDVREVAIPYVELNPVMGYESAYVPQGFNVLNEEKSQRVLDYLGADSLRWDVPPAQEALDAVFAIPGPLDLVAPGKRRVEQRALRCLLLPDVTGTCALCGRIFAKEFLRAAHIKPRAACTDDERRDLANVAMPACVFGCDSLFEQGFISVNPEGEILVSEDAAKTRGAKEYVDTFLVKREVSIAIGGRLGYFAWHMTHKFRA